MPRDVPGFETAGDSLRDAAPEIAGDWYCRSCGYLSPSRVTFSETCDTCHQPVEFHVVSEQTALARAEGLQVRLVQALRLAEGRLAMLLPASLPGSDHPTATTYVLEQVQEALAAAAPGAA